MGRRAFGSALLLFSASTESGDGTGPHVAPGTLLLCPVWSFLWSRRYGWAGGPACHALACLRRRWGGLTNGGLGVALCLALNTTHFRPSGFHEKDGKAYCRKDYFDMFAPKCGGCARAILENYISALNTLWHPECFVCRVRDASTQPESLGASSGRGVSLVVLVFRALRERAGLGYVCMLLQVPKVLSWG